MSITEFHHLSMEDALQAVSSSPRGLSSGEAASRLNQFGSNLVAERRVPPGPTRILARQLRNPFVYLLGAAGTLSAVLYHWVDVAFIALAVLVSALLGAWQEWRAEKQARSLRLLVEGTTIVRRDGQLSHVSVADLVPGDIVRVEQGDRITADMRVLSAGALTVDESLLTGESKTVRKSCSAEVQQKAPLGDRPTMLHAGGRVETGQGTAVVVRTGDKTSIAQIVAAADQPDAPRPLIRRMTQFTRHIGAAMVATICLVSALEFLRGAPATEVMLLAVALAVAAVPEGLPIAMTAALSIATRRMSLRHAVVRHLASVETLGSCTVVATDKTGTLTQHSLAVTQCWLPGTGFVSPSNPLIGLLLDAATRASAVPVKVGNGWHGDAVDLAVWSAAGRLSAPADIPEAVARIGYEPARKYGAAFARNGERLVASVKGAPETLAAMCRLPPAAEEAVGHMAGRGLRVIAVCQGDVAEPAPEALRDLAFMGIIGLSDPLRPEAKAAVGAARGAGVRVVMVTGDHRETALAIAQDLDLAQTDDEVVTGAELAGLRTADFDIAVDRARVFARTEPLQKLAIVKSLQRSGHVVAVTGDGVNDAPALRVADVGVAMGRSGADAAREASDLILTDDNFASIVEGIVQGRIAYDNLRKVIVLTLSTGVASDAPVLAVRASSSVVGGATPLAEPCDERHSGCCACVRTGRAGGTRTATAPSGCTDLRWAVGRADSARWPRHRADRVRILQGSD